MVDIQMSSSTVCCMCGDVGFPDRLFRCHKCHHRFQHSYCSNYYTELAELCDWCRSEDRTPPKHGTSSNTRIDRSEYTGDKIKQPNESGADKGSKNSGTPSPRPTTRRYKLLKDVMC